MPRYAIDKIPPHEIGAENRRDGENGFGHVGEAGRPVADRDHRVGPRIGGLPGRAEAARSLEDIGHPARDRQNEQIGGAAGGKPFAQRIEEPLRDLL